MNKLEHEFLTSNWNGVWFGKDGYRDTKKQVINKDDIYINFKTFTRVNGMWFSIVPNEMSKEENKIRMVVASILPSKELDIVKESIISEKRLTFCDLIKGPRLGVSKEFCDTYYQKTKFRIQEGDEVILDMRDEENFGKQFGCPGKNTYTTKIVTVPKNTYDRLVQEFLEESKQFFIERKRRFLSENVRSSGRRNSS